MLSMNSSTSWFCSSRKYSAMVRAERPTRIRQPGGSSIWPKTSAVSLMTPDSVISRIRPVPSRVRSPTPANTEVPPKFLATRVIISWIRTVLPTPAPPKRPILPPCTYGVSRSMTLIPVSSISVLPSSWSNRGGLRWIGQRGASAAWPGLSRQSPSTLNTWPLTTSPTGTAIAWPESATVAPRTRPSDGCIEMQRTMLSPRCWATSRVNVFFSCSSSTSTCSALNSWGTDSRGNSTSTTGPITRTTRPVAFLVAAVMSLITSCGCGECVGAADDLADLLGDLGLAGLVHLAGEASDQLVGVVGRRLHGAPAGGRLRGRGFQQRREQSRVDVPGQQRLGVRLELVHRPGRRLLLVVLDVQRRDPLGHRRLGQHRVELGVHHVQLVDAAALAAGQERLDQRLAGLGGVDVVRLLGEPGP